MQVLREKGLQGMGSRLPGHRVQSRDCPFCLLGPTPQVLFLSRQKTVKDGPRQDTLCSLLFKKGDGVCVWGNVIVMVVI